MKFYCWRSAPTVAAHLAKQGLNTTAKESMMKVENNLASASFCGRAGEPFLTSPLTRKAVY